MSYNPIKNKQKEAVLCGNLQNCLIIMMINLCYDDEKIDH